jgi:hypothetical protein
MRLLTLFTEMAPRNVTLLYAIGLILNVDSISRVTYYPRYCDYSLFDKLIIPISLAVVFKTSKSLVLAQVCALISFLMSPSVCYLATNLTLNQLSFRLSE